MPANPKTVSRLMESRRLIEVVGWCQLAWGKDAQGRIITSSTPTPGYSRMPPAAYCMGAALIKPSGVLDLGEALTFVHKAIGTTNIAKWNDDPARTKDEVLAAFSAAIDLAKAA